MSSSIFRSRRAFALSKTIFLAITLAHTVCGCASNSAALSQAAQAALAKEKGVAVYAAGDIAECKKMKPSASAAAKTADLIAGRLAIEPDAVVLTLGDATYPVGLPEEFTNCYDPTWGRFKARTFPSPGNHEYYTPEAAGYYRYFGDAAGPGRRGYYSFEVGKWHVVSLNSNLKPQDMRVQIEWLKADLAQHKTRCTLAYWHHPLFGSGGHGGNVQMREAWQVLMDAGADLVLASHDHDYERFAPQDADGRRDDQRGMREFVVGTGGARLTPFFFKKDNSELSGNYTHGVLRLLLKDSGYEWEFLPTVDGEINDKGAALCH